MTENYHGPFGNMDEVMQHRRDHEQMAQVARHQLRRLFTELSEGQLRSLNDLLHMLSSSEAEAPRVAAYYHGLGTASLEARFGVCTACDSNPCAHDQAIQGLLPPVAAPGSTEPPRGIPDVKVGESGMLLVDQQMKMLDYNLDDLREEGTNKLLGFVCNGCGMRYPSIEDRMLKQPDDCSGCHQKAKFG